MYFLRKYNMICFDISEMRQIYEASQMTALFKELDSYTLPNNLSLEDLAKDKNAMDKIAGAVVSKAIKDKSSIEFFAALDFCMSFYLHDDSKICFVLKGSPKKEDFVVKNTDDLKALIKEDTATDFAIYCKGELREFQLKQYKQNLNTDDFLHFIKNKLNGYGNNLGNINLLIILQGKGGYGNISNINFEKVHNEIKKLNLNFSGEILILYNENDKFSVINQVYPDLKSMRKEFLY